MQEFSIEIGFSLGSNLGDRLKNLSEAKRRILTEPHVSWLAQSSVYETAAVDAPPAFQDLPFLNAVLVIRSDWPVEAWLTRIAEIEDDLHRVRTGTRNEPRPIDVDIVYAGASSIDSPGLVVPHPKWATRRFVLVPLAEVRPDVVLPGSTESVKTILDRLENGETCRHWAKVW
jgi:2-amino-4-hydroxy-6-hydroxymethyldihydropteridine diphosphokinase